MPCLVLVRLCTSLARLQIPQPFVQLLAPSLQRVVDRLWRRCQSLLKDGQRKANYAPPFFIQNPDRPFELLPHIFGDVVIELLLARRKEAQGLEGSTSPYPPVIWWGSRSISEV